MKPLPSPHRYARRRFIMPRRLAETVERLAKENRRTVNGELVALLNKAIEAERHG